MPALAKGKRAGQGLYQRGDLWFVDLHYKGARYTTSFGRVSERVARELATAFRADVLRGEARIDARKAKALTFEQAAELFLDWARSNRKPRTARFYEVCLNQLAREFKGKRLDEIAPFHLEKYKSTRGREARVRCNRELATLKAMYNRLGTGKRGLGKYDGPNPVVKVEMFHESKGSDRVLDDDEEQRLLGACSEPLRTIVEVAISTGLRVKSELLELRWADVDLARARLTILGAYAKNKETVPLPISEDLVEVLREHKRRSMRTAAGDPVFVAWKGPRKGKRLRSITTALKTACRTAKLEGVTDHVFRHTFASGLVMSGCDPLTLKELDRWKDISMVTRYTHLSEKHKTEAVERFARSRRETKKGLGFPTSSRSYLKESL